MGNSKYRRQTTKSSRNSNSLQHSKTLKGQKSCRVQQLTVFESLMKVISKPSKRIHLFIAMFAVGLGFLFNYYGQMPLFWLKGIFGFFLYITLTSAIIYIEGKNKEIEFE